MATTPYVPHNEPAVISDFKKSLREFAVDHGSNFDEFPLGPQDRLTLGDDLWTTYHYFAIVESKWSEKELTTERRKLERVQRLCKALEERPDMAKLHARCHRIAWRDSEPPHYLCSQEYRKVVCKENFPDTCAAIDCSQGVQYLEDFARDFLLKNPPLHGVEGEDFVKYVKWLTQVVTGEDKNISVLFRSKDESGYTMSKAYSLSELSQLLPRMPPAPQVARGPAI